MNFALFMANKLAFTKNLSFARIIIRIAIGSVAVSLAVMIITAATITGFKNQITDKMFGFWGHIHITDTNIHRTFEPIHIKKNEAYIDKLKSLRQVEYTMEGQEDQVQILGGVQHVQNFAIVAGILKPIDNSGFESILIKGIDDTYDWLNMATYIIDGGKIDFPVEEASDDIIISSITASRLKLKTGDRVILSFIKNGKTISRNLLVKGIYKTGLEEYDKKFALLDIREVQSILGWEEDEIAGLEVRLDYIKDMEAMNEYIYLNILPPNLYSETIKTKFPAIFEWLELQNINEDVILLLMLLVCVINMITALLILILEKTELIGTLKALGANNWDIRKLFLYHAGYIILWGIVIGNIVGLSICFLQKHYNFIKLDEKNYYLSSAPIEIDWLQIGLLNIGSLILIILFLIVPSYLVSRIPPVRALRFK